MDGLKKLPVIAICGATGTGKSKLAIDIARRLNGEVINADALQLYKGLDIATNKVTKKEMHGVKHHLLGFLNPVEGFCYNVHLYRRDCWRLIDEIRGRGSMPIIVGGTHYYIEAILWDDFLRNKGDQMAALKRVDIDHKDIDVDYQPRSNRLPDDPQNYYGRLCNMDPEAAKRLHPNDSRKLQQALLVALSRQNGASDSLIAPKTPPRELNRSLCPHYPPSQGGSLIVWLTCDPNVLKPRLDERVDNMIERGLVDELNEFLDTTAKSMLPSRGDSCHNENVNEETKSAIFQLANDGMLPSTGTEHWCRGILQSIGFKEFQEYLQLPSQDRCEASGKALLAVAVAKVKTATSRYARKQSSWITNRFLRRPSTGGIPVYRLDVSQILRSTTSTAMTEALWASQILEPILQTVKALDNQPPEAPLTAEAFVETAVVSAVSEEEAANRGLRICAACGGRVFVDPRQWQDHLKSRSHRKRLAGLRKCTLPDTCFS